MRGAPRCSHVVVALLLPLLGLLSLCVVFSCAEEQGLEARHVASDEQHLAPSDGANDAVPSEPASDGVRTSQSAIDQQTGGAEPKTTPNVKPEGTKL